MPSPHATCILSVPGSHEPFSCPRYKPAGEPYSIGPQEALSWGEVALAPALCFPSWPRRELLSQAWLPESQLVTELGFLAGRPAVSDLWPHPFSLPIDKLFLLDISGTRGWKGAVLWFLESLLKN